MIKPRLASAAVGIPIILLAVWSGTLGVSLIVLAAGIVAGIELAAMASVTVKKSLLLVTPFVLHPISFALSAIFSLDASTAVVEGSPLPVQAFLSAYIVPTFSVISLTGAPLSLALSLAVVWAVLPIISALLAVFIISRKSRRRKSFGISAAALYFAGLLAFAPALVILGGNGDSSLSWSGKGFLLMAILGAFATDTGAYVFGRLFGKHKLAPSISPKKTWEGFLGGVVAGIAATVAVDAWLTPGGFGWRWAVPLGAGIGVVGIMGDLGESYLKRKTNIKNSGTLIPGHGGILDRIDSLSPILALVFFSGFLLSTEAVL